MEKQGWRFSVPSSLASAIPSVWPATAIGGANMSRPRSPRPWQGTGGLSDVSTLFRTKNLVGFSGLRIDQGSKIAMRCMTAWAVIAPLTRLTYRCLGCLVCVLVLRIDQCSLEGMKEALRHGVLPTVALPPHPRLHSVLWQELPRAVRAILPATVRLHAASRCGLPLTECQRQRLVDQLCPHVGSHGPPAHGTRAQLQDDSERPPAFARREVRHGPNGHGVGCCHRQRSVQLRRRHRLRRPCGPRRFACALGLAAQAGVRQEASKAATAPLQSGWRQPMLELARAVGATPLGTIPLSCVLPLLSTVRLGPGWAAEPLVVATARDLQELPQATHLALGVLLVHPGVLDGSWCAKYAAAFCKRSRSSCKRTLSCRR